MIDTHTEQQAALYVLNDLAGRELADFEERLRDDAELAALVRALSVGLHAPLRSIEEPPRMDLLAGIHEKLPVTPPARPRIPGPFAQVTRWTYAWAAAASILLVINLFQWGMAGRGTGTNALQASLAAQTALEEENRIVRSFNQSWEQEYMNLARRMLPFFDSRDGVGRFTVIDLVDVQDTIGNPGSRDFDDLAEFFLSNRPPMPEAEAVPQFASVQLKKHSATRAGPTVGYVVWRDDEARGFIDVYNLPEPGPGRDRFLWARSSNASAYVPVGFLPDLDEGSGSFYFSVDHPRFVPVGILITEESYAGPGEAPSSRQLMIGP